MKENGFLGGIVCFPGACRAYRFKPLRIAYLTLSSDRGGQGKSLQKA